jgi:hypothetical protein
MEMKTKLIFSGLALIAITTFASAQNTVTGNRQQNGRGIGPAFVDNNKNGICDNYENRTANISYNRWARNGKCCGTRKGQGRGRAQSNGRNFIDANKNGICDRYEAITDSK